MCIRDRFLDCVYQLLYQFPSLFEFNGRFLTSIAFHSYSLLYGTFIGNCEKERRSLELVKQTVSLWTELNSKEQFKNPLYDTSCPLVNPKDFYCDTSAARFKLWKEFYLRWSVPETEYEKKRVGRIRGAECVSQQECNGDNGNDADAGEV
eukprot:TRINITY_DN10260_c0_g1_i1.p1 TRINITY_DN10260_c0_g1~~TRINITY_DN10260_c0_g1_i1.p1  ORF type:complete len:150 (+),score=10.87 TRINITY_DN10260_c0_g1_i1:73-522(+)